MLCLLIKLYFQINHYEDQAVRMLTELSQDTIKRQRHYTDMIKEYSHGAQAILYNKKINNKDKLSLLSYCQQFINYGYLTEQQLADTDTILKKYKPEDITLMPIIFLGYLQSQGIATNFKDCTDSRNELIESGGEGNAQS